MEKYTIRLYNSQDFSLWNTFVAQSKNASFLFHRDYMEYHKNKFNDFSLMVFSEKELLALVPGCMLPENCFASHAGLTYGGIVVKKEIYLETFIEIFKALLLFLEENAIERFFLKPIPSYYCTHFSDEIYYTLFLCKAKLTRTDAIALFELQNENSISRLRKRGIEKGIKNRLKVVQDDDFETFWNQLLIPNLQAKYKTHPVHNLEEILYLKSKFPDTIKQYNVYFEKQLLAGITIFEMNEVVHPQYVSGIAALNTQYGSLDFLYHHLITEVYKNKTYFDFGMSNESQGTLLNKSLHYFKQSFGCQTVAQHFYEIPTKNHHLLNEIFI